MNTFEQNVPAEPIPKSLYEQIYDQVRRVPAGRVANYGQIAALVGYCSPRMVGYALAALRDGRGLDVPWQRVINVKGRISMHGVGSALQRSLLEEEGIVFLANDSIDMEKYRWSSEAGPGAHPAEQEWRAGE